MSTFAGESQSFGHASVNDGWQEVIKNPLQSEGIPVYFVPSWTALDPYQPIFQNYPVLDGMFSWAAWPTGDRDMDTVRDGLYMNAAAKSGKTYMAGVSPWFFTHFGYKNWIYRSERLWVQRWKEIIEMKPELVEIISWNDFGESHYLGPVKGAMPAGSEAWCNGFDHQGWLDMASYFIHAYKYGSYPVLKTDKVYFWYRTQSKSDGKADPIGLPSNSDFAEDFIEIFAVLTAPATVWASVGGNKEAFQGNMGENHWEVSFGSGSVEVGIERNGIELKRVKGDRDIDNSGGSYNYNAVVGMMEVI